MLQVHVNTHGPRNDVHEGELCIVAVDDDIYVNHDGTRFVAKNGHWYRKSGTLKHITGTVRWDVEPLPAAIPEAVFAPSPPPSPPPWTETSTCLGILRALQEAVAKHPGAVHQLGGPMERATIALLDYDKALAHTCHDGWHHHYSLGVAEWSLANECLNAVEADIPFSVVSGPCAKATDAVTEVLAALNALTTKEP